MPATRNPIDPVVHGGRAGPLVGVLLAAAGPGRASTVVGVLLAATGASVTSIGGARAGTLPLAGVHSLPAPIPLMMDGSLRAIYGVGVDVLVALHVLLEHL